jgi:hypothetical protein
MPKKIILDLNESFFHFKYAYIFLLLLSGYAVSDEKATQQPLNNCDLVVIDYQDNPEMTRAEKLDRMRQAFDASLHKFEDCHMSLSSASKNSGSGSGKSSTTSSDGTFLSNTELQGTEAEKSDGSKASKNVANDVQGEPVEISSVGSTNNGVVPEDIPQAENDDALAAQIRIAAEAESDPETRKKLWNEYRKYKGINIEQ